MGIDILDLGAKLLKDKIGGGADDKAVASALNGLLGDDPDKLDLGGLVDKLKGSGLASIADSWLGDGDNAEISEDQVREAIGGEKIKAAAAQLGGDENALLSGLKAALPQMIDKSSKGGSLLASVGGLSGLAKRFLK